ncbi:RES family NAD+ phosphorylase [Massilia antarctica]|uniref:RES family NAD+ phosphorylase n=1 Tax=Massilia antarctica TaxID=2765360 RepID=A0AA49AA47_9BURK|nr:RES family NAD+ phosphorylase [Massilia antarctica]QPI52099.1 RES family NAD+ phosphorylase [Massilia antarctica]
MSARWDFKAAAAAGIVHILPLHVNRLLRLSRFPATEPYWGKSKAYRFDDPAEVFGVTYAALMLDVAFAETILHQSGQFSDGAWFIDEKNIAARHIVGYQRPNKPLLALVNLTGSCLKALGLNNDLCSSDDYTDSMLVSASLHDQLPDVDGIMYVSRQMNTGRAVALFERSCLRRSSTVMPLKNHPAYGALLSKFNVAILPSGRTSTPRH